VVAIKEERRQKKILAQEGQLASPLPTECVQTTNPEAVEQALMADGSKPEPGRVDDIEAKLRLSLPKKEMMAGRSKSNAQRKALSEQLIFENFPITEEDMQQFQSVLCEEISAGLIASYPIPPLPRLQKQFIAAKNTKENDVNTSTSSALFCESKEALENQEIIDNWLTPTL